MSQIDRDGLYRPSAAGQLDPVHLAPHAAEREQYVAASTDRRTVDGLALWSPDQQNSGLTKSDVPAMGSPCSQQQRLLRTVPVHSPRVMQTRPAEDRGRSPPPPEMEDARYRVQRSFGERESERPDLSLGLWDKMVTVRGGASCVSVAARALFPAPAHTWSFACPLSCVFAGICRAYAPGNGTHIYATWRRVAACAEPSTSPRADSQGRQHHRRQRVRNTDRLCRSWGPCTSVAKIGKGRRDSIGR